MKNKTITNLPASIHANLLKLAKERNVEPNHIILQYINERLLHRISKSRSVESYVLKGGTLFGLLLGNSHRPTKDIDLLGLTNDIDLLRNEFIGILSMQEEDGVDFQINTITAEKIIEDERYHGVRITCLAVIGKSRNKVQIDIGFGDAVKRKKETLNTLLDCPAPVMFVYPTEYVISEKFEAMISLGQNNSRMKDFYDVYAAAQKFEFDLSVLAAAIRATFTTRKTPIPTRTPEVFQSKFFSHPDKVKQWEGFKRKAKMDDSTSLEQACRLIEKLVMEPCVNHSNTDLSGRWTYEKGWRIEMVHGLEHVVSNKVTTMEAMKTKYLWVVVTTTIKKLEESLNKLANDGFEIFSLEFTDHRTAAMHGYEVVVVARKSN